MNAFQLFTLAGIPVRVTMGFLLLIAYYAWSLWGLGAPVVGGFVSAITISILIHEFGHGLVARRLRLSPEIQLHMWGGLCAHQPARKDLHDVAIVAAGPLFQMAIGGIVWVVVALVQPRLLASEIFSWWGFAGGFAPAFVSWFVWFSVLWGALNLFVPIWPLDGGQLFRMLMLRLVRPARRAERVVHLVGLLLGIAICIFGVVVWRSTLLAVLAAMWALENGRFFYLGSGPIPVRARSELVDKILVESARAAQAGDWREARRLAFQARAEKTVTDDQLARCFAMMVVASAELHDWSEALSWSQRAPRSPAVFVARLRSLCAIGERDQARVELEAVGAPRIDPAVRAVVEGWVAGGAV